MNFFFSTKLQLIRYFSSPLIFIELKGGRVAGIFNISANFRETLIVLDFVSIYTLLLSQYSNQYFRSDDYY